MGGDGTMREGVSGMLTRAAGDRCPIFVFPVGTAGRCKLNAVDP
jgi:diacylglycerol kinase family enzyme